MSEEMQLELEHTLKTMRELKEAKAEIERLKKEALFTADTVLPDKDAEIERLRAALRAARVAVENWGSYASDFYREKWDLQGDLAHIDAALAEEKQDLVNREDGNYDYAGGL